MEKTMAFEELYLFVLKKILMHFFKARFLSVTLAVLEVAL